MFIDDFAFDKKVFILQEVKSLFFRGRHAGITPIICSQFFFAIDPSIRVNATGFMIFRLTRANEDILLSLQLSTAQVRDDKFDEVLRTSHQDSKYDFLYFDVPTQRDYQGFKYELCPPKQDEEKEEKHSSISTSQKDIIDQLIEEQAKTFGIQEQEQQH